MTVTGRLVSGEQSVPTITNATRQLPTGRALSLLPADLITQLIHTDFAAGTTQGRFDPDRTFVGNMTVGSPTIISATFTLRHNSLLMNSGTIYDAGWLVGSFLATNGGDSMSGVWLGDLPDVAVHGYFFQTAGTGQFTNSLLTGQYQGAISYDGGTDMAVGGEGLFCSDFQGGSTPTPTYTRTPMPTNTATPTGSVTVLPTYTPTPTFTGTSTPTASPTATPSPTSTSTDTGTVTPTATAMSDLTFTSTPSPTSTTRVPPSLTPTMTITPCSISFSDVHLTDYFYESVNYLYCHGAITGYADGTFRPYNNTTRGQLSKIVVLAEGWPISTPTGTPTFRDVPANSVFYPYVETAYSHSIISGYSCGTGCLEFRPGNNVTRGQLTKVVVLAEGWAISPPQQPTFRDVPASNPFFGYIETAYAHDIISGYSCGTGCLEFRPGASATRGQISKIVYLAILP